MNRERSGQEFPVDRNTALLSQYGLRQSRGSPLDDARIICLADPSHVADTKSIGQFIQDTIRAGDTILVEGVEPAREAEWFGFEGITNHVSSWEDPALYYLTLLTMGRLLLVAEAYDKAQQKPLRTRSTDQVRSFMAGRAPETDRLNMAVAALERATQQIALTRRNEKLLSHLIQSTDTTTGRVFVIAGGGHFEDPTLWTKLSALTAQPYALLEFATKPYVSPTDLDAYYRSFMGEDRVELKRLLLRELGGQSLARVGSLRTSTK